MRATTATALAALLCLACDGAGTLESQPVGSADPGAGGALNGHTPGQTGENGDGNGSGDDGPLRPNQPGTGGSNGGDPAEPGDPGAPPIVPAEEDPDFEPAPAVLHRLTLSQYRNALRALVGEGVELPADLEADTPLHGFATVGASELTISPRAAEQFEAAATRVAEQVVANADLRAAMVGCDPAADGCYRSFFERTGRRAWRRPPAGDELDALVAVAQSAAAELRDPWQGVLHGLSALLQSPDFLFRVEVGEPDPADPSKRRYTGREMASRLSFFLWDGPPDDALLDLAEQGLLVTPQGVRAAAARLLADARAEQALTRFFSEYVHLERLDGLQKDPATFPQMTATLGASMKAEIEALFRDVVFTRDADFGELLTSRRVFVNGELASLYGLPPPADPNTHQAFDLPAGHPRGGLMGTAGILAVYSHNTVTSPTLRGKFVMSNLLCFDVPPPPAGVIAELPDGDGRPETMREKVMRHRTDPTCNGCHQFMDPVGLSLENFDAIGAYRTTDQGLPIDPSGDIAGETFQGAPGLGRALRENPEVAACLVRRMYRHATGHLEFHGEEPAVQELVGRLGQGGNRLKALALEVVSSPGFRLVGEAE